MSGLDDLYGDESEAKPAADAPQAQPPAEPATPAAPDSESRPAQPEAQPEQPVQAHETPDRDLAGLIRALQDEREKRQQATREAADLRAWRQEQERKRQEAAANVPNVLDDPEGYHAWVQEQFGRMNRGFEQRLSTALQRNNLESSMEKWSDKLGKEEFEKLHAWTATMPPQWVRQAESQRDPFGFAYREYEKVRKAQRAEELDKQLQGKSLDEIVAERVKAALEAAQTAEPAQPSQPRNANGTFAAPSEPQQRHRPKSLAEMNGASAVAAQQPGSALDGLFGE